MRGPIGYYVHHHGDGHRQRALAIAKSIPDGVILLGTGLSGKTENIPSLDLAGDSDDAINASNGNGVGESLHYAPHHHDGARQRVAAISDWVMREKPALIVVDVSVEVAMLARLTSTPMVYVRLSGRRIDLPHLDAFRAAIAIFAPFHSDLDDTDVVSWVRDKTTYLPGLSRSRACSIPTSNRILVVCGKGGPPFELADLVAAAVATPDMRWRVIGPVASSQKLPSNLEIIGWVATADEEIASAVIVVGQAGDGLVNAVLAAERPFICVPQQRPFDEQTVKAKRLYAMGAAIIVETWPPAAAWPELLCRARNLDPAKAHRLHDPRGAMRAAQWLRTLAI